MLKKISFCILILCIFSSQLSKLAIYVNFKLNQNYISEVLCVNKDVPTSTCDGKCYLSKELKNQEKKEDKQTPNKSNERTEVLFCDYPYCALSCFSYLIETTFILPKNLELNTQDFINEVFHPPQLV